MTFAEVKRKCKKIGGFKNVWRNRFVWIFEHHMEEYRGNMVITVGVPEDNSKEIICVESRELCLKYIGTYGQIFR